MRETEISRGSAAIGSPGLRRIGPEDIQQKEFRLAFRGYDERDVDLFLDELTEEVARLRSENERLMRQLEFRGTQELRAGSTEDGEAILGQARQEADALLQGAREEKEAILGQARQEADRIRAGAKGEAVGAAAGTASDSGRLDSFVSREREFLQSLASLIQSHAEAVKADLRSAGSGRPVTPGVETTGAGRSSPQAVVWRPEAGPEAGPSEAGPPGAAAGATTGAGAIAGMPSSGAMPASEEESLEEPGGEPGARLYEPPEEEPERQRSIRELFWGSD